MPSNFAIGTADDGYQLSSGNKSSGKVQQTIGVSGLSNQLLHTYVHIRPTYVSCRHKATGVGLNLTEILGDAWVKPDGLVKGEGGV